MVCCNALARHFPCNFIVLTLFVSSLLRVTQRLSPQQITLAAGVTLMVVCVRVPPYTVGLALVTTTATCVGVIIFASQTKYDITRAPEIGTFARDVVESALGFRRHMKTLSNVRRDAEDLPQTFSNVRRGFEWNTKPHTMLSKHPSGVSIQMILGGRKYELSPEEYIYAALMLFVDIYEIFINMLNLINAAE
ncbi:unnamed protein product [Heligmosomoides polygyrus]|uniref:Uncharacterized protein n=1 Tax=Heligmosomoides polygyrus TaxID=6339 RepID=A0A3P8DYG0_HELPZ|nr:unnamed protein product [Heligmosomoides polygyrus]